MSTSNKKETHKVEKKIDLEKLKQEAHAKLDKK